MRQRLGEFEHLILLAILHLGKAAYGAAIIDELERRTEREVSDAAAYIALRRLREKGLLEARDGDSRTDRGGRRRRYFSVTEAGFERLQTSGGALFRMWNGLEGLLEGID